MRYEDRIKNPDVDYNIDVYYSGKNCSLHELKGLCEMESAISHRKIVGKGTFKYNRKNFVSWIAKNLKIDESQIVSIHAESSTDIYCPMSDGRMRRKTVDLNSRNLWGNNVPSKIKRFVRNKIMEG